MQRARKGKGRRQPELIVDRHSRPSGQPRQLPSPGRNDSPHLRSGRSKGTAQACVPKAANNSSIRLQQSPNSEPPLRPYVCGVPPQWSIPSPRTCLGKNCSLMHVSNCGYQARQNQAPEHTCQFMISTANSGRRANSFIPSGLLTTCWLILIV